MYSRIAVIIAALIALAIAAQARAASSPDELPLVTRLAPKAGAPVAAVPGGPVTAEVNDAATLADLNKKHDEFKATYQGFNQMNPLNAPGGQPAAGKVGTEAAALVPNNPALAQVQKVKGLLNNPLIAGYMRVLSNPNVLGGFAGVLKHPNRNLLFGGQALLIILLLVFRAWRQSKAKSWGGRLWISAYSMVCFVALSTILLPSFLIGDSYVSLLREIWKSVA